MNLADRAAAFIGQGIREVSGPTSHPQILAWIKRCEKMFPTDLTIDDSKYAWCGVFVGNMLLDDIAAGSKDRPQPPAYFQGAGRWEAWGLPIKQYKAQRGDVVVLKRTGGKHVAIVSKATEDGVEVIGGNQSDAVTKAFYPLSKVIAVRRG